MPQRLRLISHPLCPYVQRAVIVASEKDLPVEKVMIDLAAKPDWFLKLSPTGKVPLLEVTETDGSVHILFESAVIAEYLDEIGGGHMLASEPVRRARERAWIEFGSAILADIARVYSASTAQAFNDAHSALRRRFDALDREIAGPWFSGTRFGLVDATFGPIFRYRDAFLRYAGFDLLADAPRVRDWAGQLAKRPSVATAVAADYDKKLAQFLWARNSHLRKLMQDRLLEAA